MTPAGEWLFDLFEFNLDDLRLFWWIASSVKLYDVDESVVVELGVDDNWELTINWLSITLLLNGVFKLGGEDSWLSCGDEDDDEEDEDDEKFWTFVVFGKIFAGGVVPVEMGVVVEPGVVPLDGENLE